jgi:hypothetical protein
VTVPSLKEFGARFIAGFNKGKAGWQEAAETAREALKAYPEFPAHISEILPEVPEEFVYRFCGIGVKYMAELCIMECPGAKRLRKLPLQIQERCMADSVEVAIQDREGRWTSLFIAVQNLTKAQAEQVFAKDRVRSLAEQRAWLEDRREQKRQAQSQTAIALANTGLPYRVTRTHFIFGEHSVTWKEILRLAKDAKSLKA